MDALTLAGFAAHSKTISFQRRVNAALELLHAEVDASCYVSFSAGKDSAVCAHLAQEVRPGIEMLMADPGCPTHWTEEERAAWLNYAGKNGWNIKLFAWDKWSAVSDAASIEGHRKKAHESMFSDLHAYADAHGLTRRIMGLRAEESKSRAITIRHLGAVYDYRDGGGRILPIADWSYQDVWAYTVTRGLPWLSVYDFGGPKARNGLIGRSGMDTGRLSFLREHYPDAYRLARNLLKDESYA